MRVVLDTCIWGGARAALTAAGHEVEWTGEWETDPGDRQILEYAASNRAVLVTLDKDFGELAILENLPHCGIIRLDRARVMDQGVLVAEALLRYGAELSAGAVVTIEPGRVRVRPGPSPEERG